MKKILMVFLIGITLFGVNGLGQCPLTQAVTPAPTSISLALVLEQSALRFQQFEAEVASLVIEQQTELFPSGDLLSETVWVTGNRYRLERTRSGSQGTSTLTYIFDGERRWIVTPGGQVAETSVLETPQPWVDWSQWFNDSYDLDGLGDYMDHPVFMLNHPQPDDDSFKEVWVDAERLLPLVVRQDTLFGRYVTVFADHRLWPGTQVGWLPWLRELYTEGELIERTQVLSVAVGEALDPALFETP